MNIFVLINLVVCEKQRNILESIIWKPGKKSLKKKNKYCAKFETNKQKPSYKSFQGQMGHFKYLS